MRLQTLLGVTLASLSLTKGETHSTVGQRSDQSSQATLRTTPLLTNFPGMGSLPSLDQTSFAPSGINFSNVQGDILAGMRKPKETFIFFRITSPPLFKLGLTLALPMITSTSDLLGPILLQPLAFVNIAFSASGLKALGVTDDLGDTHFTMGQFADGSNLGDVTSLWESSFTNSGPIHGVFLVGSDTKLQVDAQILLLKTLFKLSFTEVTRVVGSARPGTQAGHEHFGFLDGISNPIIQSWSSSRLPGQVVVPDGVILTGHDGDSVTRSAWAVDGSFLVFRKLKQLVPEFNTFTRTNALTHAFDSVTNKTVSLTPSAGAELLSARMLGRWKSGAPLDLVPLVDDPALGGDPNRNNNFAFSHPGMNVASDQSRCPFSAHIRKTRPRVDLEFGGGSENTVNQAIRGGIPYGDEVDLAENASGTTTRDRGLAFVEYQSSITNGFIRQQQQWANDAQFPPRKSMKPGLDPIIAQNPTTSARARQTFGLDPTDPTKGYSISPFVIPVGGEYFFSPSISAIATKIIGA